MEDSLPHTAPVLHVPAVLGVEVRVSRGTVTLSQLSQDLRPGIPEGGRVWQLPHEGELLGGGSDGVPEAEIYPGFALIGRNLSRLCSDWLDLYVATPALFKPLIHDTNQ